MNNKPNEKVEIYYGLEGYTNPLVKRIEAGQNPLKQIINGEAVSKFHKRTNDLVKNMISKRVEKGIEIKNLIRQEDKKLEIELTNPQTLKETRLLPKSFETQAMISIFGNSVGITSLNEKEPFGLIINDEIIAQTFNSMFDTIWNASQPV